MSEPSTCPSCGSADPNHRNRVVYDSYTDWPCAHSFHRSTSPGREVTDEMAEAAGRALADEFGLSYHDHEAYTEAYWNALGAKVLSAALGVGVGGENNQ